MKMKMNKNIFIVKKLLFLLPVFFITFFINTAGADTKTEFDPLKRDWSFKGNINKCNESKSFYYIYSSGGPIEEAEKLKNYVIKIADSEKKKNPDKIIKVMADKDFNDDMWGHGVVYLIGPFKYHLLMKKYFSNTFFNITDSSISVPFKAKENYFKRSAKSSCIIFHWPQPGGEGQTVLYTGSNYSSVENIFSQHHGLTDFVVSNNFFKRQAAPLAFSVIGFYEKKCRPWKYNKKRSASTTQARAFFTKELKWNFDTDKIAKALKKEIVLKSGEKFNGSLFGIDQMRVLIRYFENGKKRYAVKHISDIESVDNSKAILAAIYRPKDSGNTQLSSIELILEPKPVLRALAPCIRINKEGKIMRDSYFCSRPPLLLVQDMFGQTLESESTLDKDGNLFNHHSKYRIPVEPGDTEILIPTFEYAWSPVKKKNGNYLYHSNHVPGPRTKYRLNLTIPSGDVLNIIPEPVDVLKSAQKTKIQINKNLEPGEGIYTEVEFKKK